MIIDHIPCDQFVQNFRKTVLEIIFWFNFKTNFNSLNNHKHTLSGPIHFLEIHFIGLGSDFSQKISKYCVWVPVRTQTKIYSEFNSIHFSIEIDKLLKFLTPISFWV